MCLRKEVGPIEPLCYEGEELMSNWAADRPDDEESGRLEGA
jgi:hypothetical protein